MDAVFYLKEKERMCKAFLLEYGSGCEDCRIYKDEGVDCMTMEAQSPERMVSMVKKWSDKHPTNAQKYNDVFGKDGCIALSRLSKGIQDEWWDKTYKEPNEE